MKLFIAVMLALTVKMAHTQTTDTGINSAGGNVAVPGHRQSWGSTSSDTATGVNRTSPTNATSNPNNRPPASDSSAPFRRGTTIDPTTGTPSNNTAPLSTIP